MAPEMDKVLNEADQGRRDFLRRIIAGAAFAPPLLASFSLDGLSIASASAPINPNMCIVSNATIPPRCFAFNGHQYELNFTEVLGGADIASGPDLGGTGHTAVNFTGSAGPAGRVWVTLLNSSPTATTGFELSLSADVLIHRYNNSKGVGLVALAFRLAGDKSLALIVNDAGNTDALQLFTVSNTGQATLLQSVPLGAGIAENVWYRLEMTVERGALCVPSINGPVCPVSVTGEVFRHVDPSDPDSGLGAQVGGTLTFDDNLTFQSGGSIAGQVGMIGRAVSTAVDSSVTNFCVICHSEPLG